LKQQSSWDDTLFTLYYLLMIGTLVMKLITIKLVMVEIGTYKIDNYEMVIIIKN